ncbi:MAG: biotin--[acetyl-CoA-carboxylase] ligase [Leptolyngbya foveolarum]|uniref:Biotin--[acetyl-CoA-carboxylase] ligase n=1 Tax=Leptolyngbya foveolarum TaxID=47253 RepID=A0A2W4UKJ3_9CYAN|nr:MAG: biotin--[acetyl-CoA-carboxylase] ligase [Leptolyngbya foveolarum]
MVSTRQTFGWGEAKWGGVAIAAEGFYAALNKDAAELGVSAMFRAIRPRFDLHVFDHVDSTSTQLWRMLASGYGAGTVAIARQQSAGRGQRGRVWQSEPGGLYLSLAMEPDWPVADAAQLTCLSAWGIAIALNNLGVPIRVKWPNDLFFEGKKLGGILTETKLAYSPAAELSMGAKPLGYIKQAVVGVGINWHNPTPETGVSLVKILESLPGSLAKIKINCLEMLGALVLRGILQGVFFQQRVGSQVFMKDYEKLLTQFKKPVLLDRKLLDQMVFSEESSGCETNPSQPSLSKEHLLSQLLNRSGEVVGLSEKGYLKVALKGTPIEWSGHDRLGVTAAKSILLFAPSAIGF